MLPPAARIAATCPAVANPSRSPKPKLGAKPNGCGVNDRSSLADPLMILLRSNRAADHTNRANPWKARRTLRDLQTPTPSLKSASMTVYETTNHQTIYHWATARGLWPASVAGSPDRIRLGGDEFSAENEDLEPIEWWRWFQEFDRRRLQLIYDPSKGWFTLGSRLAPSGS